MLVGGITACLEKDRKKVVAFSTLSQLGLLLFSLGIFDTLVFFVHLIAHAFVKALLFIVIGLGIFVRKHEQIEKLFSNNFSIFRKLIISTSLFSLSGFLFLSGFSSKHLIRASILDRFSLILLCI
jgi:NADH-quinone oxidoreductase subunit L